VAHRKLEKMETPRIFISHSSRNRRRAERLANALKAWGADVWYAPWEILVGHDFVEDIYDGIRECDYLAILLTRHSVASKWVKEELNRAKVKQIRDNKTFILPLLYEKDVEIPEPIKTIQYADFTRDYEKGIVQVLQAIGLLSANDDRDLFVIASEMKALINAFAHHKQVIPKKSLDRFWENRHKMSFSDEDVAIIIINEMQHAKEIIRFDDIARWISFGGESESVNVIESILGHNEHADIHHVAILCLRLFKPNKVETIVFNHINRMNRRALLASLTMMPYIGTRRALDILVARVNDDDETIRDVARLALRDFGSFDVIPVLLEIINAKETSNELRQILILTASESNGNKDSLKKLLLDYQDSDRFSLEFNITDDVVFKALANIGDSDCEKCFLDLLNGYVEEPRTLWASYQDGEDWQYTYGFHVISNAARIKTDRIGEALVALVEKLRSVARDYRLRFDRGSYYGDQDYCAWMNANANAVADYILERLLGW
jgi:hypothetical protein